VLILMNKEQPDREAVPFWFDPLCPWAWITSRWLLEVEQVRPVRVDWRIMSLAYLNLVQREGKGLSEDYRDLMTKAWGPVRVCAAAAEHSGHSVLGPLYTTIGTRLPVSLASAATSTEFDQLIKDSHDEAFNEVGLDVGTPVLRIGDITLFGPVITPAPRGEAAGRLWDGLVMIAGTDGFFELKRSRDRKPSFQ
jgi:hypothetical protein